MTYPLSATDGQTSKSPAKGKATPAAVASPTTRSALNDPIVWLVRYFGLRAATLLFAVLRALRLDVNEFSMNLLYRNRLVRTFLGASNPKRKPSLFTGFAINDDLALDTLTTTSTEGYPFQGPYPIWGTTLNITAGEDLAWQHRQGASFIYSSLYCGWDYVDPSVKDKQPEEPAQDPDKYGYRSTLPTADGPGYGGVGGKPFI